MTVRQKGFEARGRANAGIISQFLLSYSSSSFELSMVSQVKFISIIVSLKFEEPLPIWLFSQSRSKVWSCQANKIFIFKNPTFDMHMENQYQDLFTTKLQNL